MTDLDSILKSRDITFLTKLCLDKAVVLPVVMYGCESWTIKKAECWRIDAFELWCWRRLLRVPWTARRSNQSIQGRSVLGVHWKDWCWGWNSNTLATSCKELTYWKRPWWWEELRTGGEGDDGGWDAWMASPTRWTWVWTSSGSWWWTGKPGMLQSMELQRVWHDWAPALSSRLKFPIIWLKAFYFTFVSFIKKDWNILEQNEQNYWFVSLSFFLTWRCRMVLDFYLTSNHKVTLYCLQTFQ